MVALTQIARQKRLGTVFIPSRWNARGWAALRGRHRMQIGAEEARRAVEREAGDRANGCGIKYETTFKLL